jgi:hypothetical protein
LGQGDDLNQLYWHALACLAIDDRPGFQAVCKHMLEIAGPNPEPSTANDIASNCALGPLDASMISAAVRLGEIALARVENDTTPGVRGQKYAELNTVGSVLFRAGRVKEAIVRLEQAIQNRAPYELVHDELFLAMANHRLGNHKEADRYLRIAREWMDRYRNPAAVCGSLAAGQVGPIHTATALLAERPDPRSGQSDFGLRNWLEMEVLRAEAERVVGGEK